MRIARVLALCLLPSLAAGARRGATLTLPPVQVVHRVPTRPWRSRMHRWCRCQNGELLRHHAPSSLSQAHDRRPGHRGRPFREPCAGRRPPFWRRTGRSTVPPTRSPASSAARCSGSIPATTEVRNDRHPFSDAHRRPVLRRSVASSRSAAPLYGVTTRYGPGNQPPSGRCSTSVLSTGALSFFIDATLVRTSGPPR